MTLNEGVTSFFSAIVIIVIVLAIWSGSAPKTPVESCLKKCPSPMMEGHVVEDRKELHTTCVDRCEAKTDNWCDYGGKPWYIKGDCYE